MSNLVCDSCKRVDDVVISLSRRVVSLGLQVKGKVFPYSLPSVGPGADPGVQAVNPQVT